MDIITPTSFVSRSRFKDKIEEKLGGIIQLYRPHVDLSDRQTIIIPTRYQAQGISQLAEKVDEELSIPSYHPDKEDAFSALVHVALNVKSDVMNKITKPN